MSNSTASLAAYFMSFDSPELVESAQAAERAGYRRAWLNDAHTLWQDVYVHMTRVLDRTEDIRIGSGVTNPVTRHFSVAASAHATLASMHPGRVTLGLGRGDAAVHAMGLKPMLTRDFAPQARMIRSLLKGESVSVVEGRDFAIRWLGNIDVPIMMGATGPTTLRIAGGIADIVQMEVGTSEAAIKWGISNVHAGAEEAGRDPSEIEISLCCAMWVDDDIDVARAKCRWGPSSAANHIGDVMKRPGHGMPPEMTELVEIRQQSMDEYDYDSHLDSEAEDTAWLTEELIDNFSIAGDAARCTERIRALAALGVSEIASGFLNGEYDQMRQVGEGVIASLNVPEAEQAAT